MWQLCVTFEKADFTFEKKGTFEDISRAAVMTMATYFGILAPIFNFTFQTKDLSLKVFLANYHEIEVTSEASLSSCTLKIKLAFQDLSKV